MPDSTPFRITLRHFPRWTRCSCGHIAQDHNVALPLQPGEPQNYACDYRPDGPCERRFCNEPHTCTCAGYDGSLVWYDTRVPLTQAEREAWQATLRLAAPAPTTPVISNPPAPSVRWAWED